MAARIFKKLFLYDRIEEVNGKIYFSDVKLHKAFPFKKDDAFVIGNEKLYVVLDPVEGTVCLQRDGFFDKSKNATLKEWLDSDGITRTDSFKH